jgi:K+ transporter
MNLKDALEELKQLPPATQVAVVLFSLVLLVLLAVVPTLGTSILAFLVALKTLTTR